jgi:hypothetical protein
LALGNTPVVNLAVNFSDGFIKKSITCSSCVKTDGEENRLELLVRVSEFEGGVA